MLASSTFINFAPQDSLICYYADLVGYRNLIKNVAISQMWEIIGQTFMGVLEFIFSITTPTFTSAWPTSFPDIN